MNELYDLAEVNVKALAEKGLTVSFAESCTGGLISKLITDVPGASAVLPGAVCSYANEIKSRVLGVEEKLLRKYGAVSRPVALEMARGVKKLMRSDISVSVTGIAGPSSDGTDKSVGLVYIALALPGSRYVCHEHHFDGGRSEIREQTAFAALNYLYYYVSLM